MLSQLFNIISNYSISIQAVNLEYFSRYEYFIAFKYLACRLTAKIYNYRKSSGNYNYHVYDSKMRYVAELPRNYI